MKGKTTVNGSTVNSSSKAPITVAQGTRGKKNQDHGGYAPAVPISVYRELAKELEKAKQQLSTVKAHNISLKQQNQALRQEVIRVIQSAAALKDILQAPQPSLTPPSPQVKSPGQDVQSGAPFPQTLSTSNTVADELIAELDRTLTADISTSFQGTSGQLTSAKSTDGIVGGPFCELVVPELTEQAPESSPEPLFTEQPTTPPNAIALESEEKSGILGGIWLPLTLVVVIVTAFSAGFLIVLPFIEADKNN